MNIKKIIIVIVVILLVIMGYFVVKKVTNIGDNAITTTTTASIGYKICSSKITDENNNKYDLTLYQNNDNAIVVILDSNGLLVYKKSRLDLLNTLTKSSAELCSAMKSKIINIPSTQDGYQYLAVIYKLEYGNEYNIESKHENKYVSILSLEPNTSSVIKKNKKVINAFSVGNNSVSYYNDGCYSNMNYSDNIDSSVGVPITKITLKKDSYTYKLDKTDKDARITSGDCW